MAGHEAGKRLAAALGILMVVAPLLSAQTTARNGEQTQAAFQAHKDEFNYLLGDWEFRSVSKQYGEARGLRSAVRLDEGQILDEYRVLGDRGPAPNNAAAGGSWIVCATGSVKYPSGYRTGRSPGESWCKNALFT